LLKNKIPPYLLALSWYNVFMAEEAESAPEKKEREVEIKFGTLIKIKSKADPDRIDVVDNVGSEEYEGFYSGNLHHPDDKKKRWFFPGGTTLPELIEDIVGQLSEEEVIAAAQRGWLQYVSKGSNQKLIEEGSEMMKRHLREAAQKGPRKIKIG
jgi:hypothetical protein